MARKTHWAIIRNGRKTISMKASRKKRQKRQTVEKAGGKDEKG